MLLRSPGISFPLSVVLVAILIPPGAIVAKVGGIISMGRVPLGWLLYWPSSGHFFGFVVLSD